MLQTREQHAEAMEELRRLFELDPAEGTAEADRLEHLALLVEHYEKETFHFDKPSPVEMLEFYMEQNDLKQKDLVPYIGSA